MHTFLYLQMVYIYAMPAPTVGQMGRTRALMTETDRRYIAGEDDVDDSKRYQAISRVRDRLEELDDDIDILQEHHPELLSELRTVVCEEHNDEHDS